MQLLGRELSISKQKEYAAVIIGLFSKIGAENAELFGDRFINEFDTLDDALSGIGPLSDQYFNAAVKRANGILISYEIHSFTEQSLTDYLKKRGYFGTWEKSLAKFHEKNDLINSQLQAEGPEKEAAALQAKAKVLDLMSQFMVKYMLYTISDFASAIINIINKETTLSIAPPTQEEITRSKEIYDNVISGKTPAKDRDDAIFEAITLNPNNAEAFYFLILKYGDSDYAIENAGEQFGNPIGQMKLDGFPVSSSEIPSAR